MFTTLRKTSRPSSFSCLAGSRRCGRGRAQDAERHDRVDVEHRLELVVGHLVGDAVAGVAGVVDDDVDLAELVDGLLDQLVRHALLGEVAAEHRGLARDLRRRLLGDVAVEVVDEHARALLGEQLRGRAADSTRRSGDDRRLSVQDSHSILLSWLSAGHHRYMAHARDPVRDPAGAVHRGRGGRRGGGQLGAAAALFFSAASAVLLLNVLYRIGVQGDKERDREDEARALLRRARPLAGLEPELLREDLLHHLVGAAADGAEAGVAHARGRSRGLRPGTRNAISATSKAERCDRSFASVTSRMASPSSANSRSAW